MGQNFQVFWKWEAEYTIENWFLNILGIQSMYFKPADRANLSGFNLNKFTVENSGHWKF